MLIAEKAAGPLKRAIVNLIKGTQTAADLDKVGSALESGKLDRLFSALGLDEAEQKLTELLSERLIDVMAQAGQAAGDQFGMTFDKTNPKAVKWIEKNSAKLVTNVTKETKQAIREVMRSGFVEGQTVRQMAREIRGYVGLTERDAAAGMKLRDSLYADHLERFGSVDSAAIEQIADSMDRWIEKKIAARSEMIARTETINASNAGQRQLWNQAASAGLFDPEKTQRIWIASADACPICDELNDTLVPFGEEFPDGDPAVHPGCRCTTGLVFDEEPSRADEPLIVEDAELEEV